MNCGAAPLFLPGIADELLDDIDAVYREVREPTLMSKTRVEKKKEAAQKAAEKVAA